MKAQKSEKVLLVGKERSFLIDTSQKKFHSNYGELDLTKVKIGKKVKTNLGHEFTVIKPTIVDLLKKVKRGPQIVTPKDAAAVISICGVESGWRCLDAGAGSGFLSLFIGNIVKPNGHVYAYEKNKGFAKIVEYNIRFCGLKGVVLLKNKDASTFTEKELDLVTLDMIDSDKLVPKVHKALRVGGWLYVYSPHIEQQKKAVAAMEKLGFVQIQTIENIQRFWKVDARGFTHPKPSGLLHTGFMTFGRKI
jgi:tRNA (adenine57-N1/adenine58-N1)-methyltransferase